MKKRFIGLMVCILCAATAWGQGAVTDSLKISKTSSIHKKDTLSEVPAYAASGKSTKDSVPAVTMSPVPSLTATPLSTSASLAPLVNDDIVADNLNTNMVSYIQSFYEDNNKHLAVVQSKGGEYFSMIENVFHKFGIPDELKYLAVIESGLNTNAVSRAGAVGAWQLMAGTARLLGLKVSRRQDDRRNLYKSTTAAAKYLNQLYDMLQDWVLVVAAYNCGPGGVLKAIDASGSNNFWDLQNYLPTESRNHVKKFLATAYIMDRFASFFGLSKSDVADMMSNDQNDDDTDVDPGAAATKWSSLQTVTISGKYSMPIIAKYLSMSISDLNSLNPGFDQMMSSQNNRYTLRLPAEKMNVFKSNQGAILNESVQLLMDSNRQLTNNGAAYPAAKALPQTGKNKKG